MQSYQYRVAISFAGEQRTIAEAIAVCIRNGGGGPVFYDKNEKARLWGKDLYEHLVEIYRDKAQFCIILVSRQYLEKEWTVHERKSAQARALENKGEEYILPVDIDGTRLPGLLETIGYLSFAKEGVRGVCRTFLEKIDMLSPFSVAPPIATPVNVTSSPRAVLVAGKTALFLPVVRSSWSSMVSLLVEPDDQADGPILTSIRPGTRPLLAAYQQNVALGELESNTHSTDGTKSTWELRVRVERDSFEPDMEPGTGGISAEQFAEQRARRLLLNEYPAREAQDMNEIMIEVLRRGQGTIAKVERSPFPELFKSFGQDPQVFLESAWIMAAMQLRLSGCVITVNSLRLGLKGQSLSVDFVGTRHRKYTNVDPYVMRINGECQLQS
jgi:hypothetical protein